MKLRLFLLLACVFAVSLCACGTDDGADVPERCGPNEQRIGGECVPGRDVGGADDTAGIDDGGESATDTGDDPSADVSEDTGITPDTAADNGVGDDTGCVDGATGCSELGVPQECISGVWVDGEPCPVSQVCIGGRCVAGAECDSGEVAGCWSETEQRVCNDAGNDWEARLCPDDLFCFRGECGTQICEPDRRSCSEDSRWVTLCAPTGEEWVQVEECNPRDDLVCNLGECVSGCAAALKNPAYIGCEYWSVDLPQYQDPFGDPRVIPHAVVVANTGDRVAEVTIETRSGIPLVDERVDVSPGAVATLLFPRADVEDTSRSNRSFRIQTSEPVVAYQFNPLNDVGVASNDASLLLPANAIGSEYYVMSWPSGVGAMGFAPQTGWFTIVGTTEEPAEVTITFSAPLIDGVDADLRGITADSTHTFELEQFAVMNFEALSSFFAIGDLTGTHIESTRPIVVFAGHEEAVIGDEGDGSGPCCADHLEQQLFPVDTWGTRYMAVHSPPRGREIDVWRVLAAHDGTRITTVPPIGGLDGQTLNAGDWVEVETVESFEVVGSEPILVGQYLVSQLDQGIDATKGDPAFILAVPAAQYRDDYVVLTPDDYDEDWITVIRPTGVRVDLDGTTIPDDAFTPFGTLEYEHAYMPVEPGPHVLVSPTETAFGIAMFGYNTAVSYGYPGGMNLATEFEVVDP